MTYIWYFSAIGFLFAAVTSVFYLRQRRVPSPSGRLYVAMLLLTCMASLLDVLAAVTDAVSERLPHWLLYISNILFLTSMQLLLPVSLLFVVLYLGSYPRIHPVVRFLACLPCAAVIGLLLISPFTKLGIFYIDEATGRYRHGACYAAQYASALIYLILILLIALTDGRSMARGKRQTIVVFCSVVAASVVLQLIFTPYLFNTFAVSLALTMIYHRFITSSESIDPITELFNRSALKEVITSLDERKKRFTLLTLSISNYRLASRTLGARTGERMLSDYSVSLRRNFSGCYLFRMGSGTFVVIDTKEGLEQRIGAIAAQLPDRLDVGGMPVGISSWIAMIKSNDFPDRRLMLLVVDYVLHMSAPPEGSAPLLVDASIAWRLERANRTQTALTQVVSGNRLVVRYQPVLRDGRLWALEARPCVPDSLDLRSLSSDDLSRLSREAGCETELFMAVLTRVCEMLGKDDAAKRLGIEHVRFKLPYRLCSSGELCPQIRSIVETAGVKPGMICFELIESNDTETIPAAETTLAALAGYGFSLALGSFGVGHNDFGRLSRMPLVCVRLSHILVRAAAENQFKQTILESIVAILRELGLTSVCSGVDQEAIAEVVRSSGADAVQGTVIAPVMSRETLLDTYCGVTDAEQ